MYIDRTISDIKIMQMHVVPLHFPISRDRIASYDALWLDGPSGQSGGAFYDIMQIEEDPCSFHENLIISVDEMRYERIERLRQSGRMDVRCGYSHHRSGIFELKWTFNRLSGQIVPNPTVKDIGGHRIEFDGVLHFLEWMGHGASMRRMKGATYIHSAEMEEVLI